MLLEDLQKLVEQNLSSICSNLQILKSQKKLLFENADKVKSTIKDSIDTQANLLKMKERQLIRQIEFVTAHQNSLIDAQIANIMLSKGSLMTSQDILSRCDTEDVETLVKISDCTHISVKPISTLKMVSVQLDSNQLSSAIENFGQAHLPDSIMHHHSSVVPAKLEDYGDSDQVVLHKSINMSSDNITSGGDSSFIINVNIPKLPKNSWLASSPKKAPNVLPTISPSKGQVSWLAGLRVAEEKEGNKMWLQNKMEDDESGSFQFLDDTSINFFPEKSHKSVCPRSCGSSSIEIVNSVESKELYKYSKHNEGSHLWREQPVAKNLLSSTIPDIEFACQANELCKSCDDCVCQNYCESLAREKALQTSKWLEKSHFQKELDSQAVFPRSFSFTPVIGEALVEDQVVKHMIDIQNSDNKDWLTKPHEEKKIGYQFAKFSPDTRIFHSPSSEKTWLQGNISESIVKNEMPISSTTSKTWLLCDINIENKSETNQLNVEKSLAEEDKGKEEKDNKNIENKLSFAELKEALNDIDVEQSILKDKKYRFYSPSESIRKNHLAETDCERKFRWLFNSSITSPNISHEYTYKVSPKICSFGLPTRKANKWLLENF